MSSAGRKRRACRVQSKRFDTFEIAFDGAQRKLTVKHKCDICIIVELNQGVAMLYRKQVLQSSSLCSLCQWGEDNARHAPVVIAWSDDWIVAG
jgi:hypothetical protein